MDSVTAYVSHSALCQLEGNLARRENHPAFMSFNIALGPRRCFCTQVENRQVRSLLLFRCNSGENSEFHYFETREVIHHWPEDSLSNKSNFPPQWLFFFFFFLRKASDGRVGAPQLLKSECLRLVNAFLGHLSRTLSRHGRFLRSNQRRKRNKIHLLKHYFEAPALYLHIYI